MSGIVFGLLFAVGAGLLGLGYFIGRCERASIDAIRFEPTEHGGRPL